MQLTLRLRRGLPSLREQVLYRAIEHAIGATGRSPTGLRIVHFSVQSNHLHFLVEAPGRDALCRGAKGLAIRLARAINALLGIAGRVWGDRYHVQELESPRQVRNALVYVLLNWKKHVRGARGVDPCSSGAAFDGWRPTASGGTASGGTASGGTAWGAGRTLSAGTAVGGSFDAPRPPRTSSNLSHVAAHGPPLVHRPRTWLLSAGWRRRGRIDLRETPRRLATPAHVRPRDP